MRRGVSFFVLESMHLRICGVDSANTHAYVHSYQCVKGHLERFFLQVFLFVPSWYVCFPYFVLFNIHTHMNVHPFVTIAVRISSPCWLRICLQEQKHMSYIGNQMWWVMGTCRGTILVPKAVFAKVFITCGYRSVIDILHDRIASEFPFAQPKWHIVLLIILVLIARAS